MLQKSTAGYLAEVVFIQNFFFLNFWSKIGLGCISTIFWKISEKNLCSDLSVLACLSMLVRPTKKCSEHHWKKFLYPKSSRMEQNTTKTTFLTKKVFFWLKKVVFDRMPPPVSSRYYRLHTLVFLISSDWKLKKWNHNIFVNRKL